MALSRRGRTVRLKPRFPLAAVAFHPVRTENLIRVDDVMESLKLAE
jgi:hypothetical protein